MVSIDVRDLLMITIDLSAFSYNQRSEAGCAALACATSSLMRERPGAERNCVA